MTRARTAWEELAAAYGTPLYAYQRSAVRAAAGALRESLPAGVRIFYSVKANPHPAIVAAATGEGLDVEVSSVGELDAAVAAGAPVARGLYTGPGKTLQEIGHALRSGIGLFSVESPADRDRLVTAAGRYAADRDVDYLVRLNAAEGRSVAGLRMTGTPSQFGVDAGRLAAGVDLLAPHGRVRPAGWHVFSATDVASEDALLAEFAATIDTVRAASARTGLRPRLVDIGGGFGAPYAAPGRRPDYPRLRSGLARLLDDGLPGWRDGGTAVAVESGRYLTAEAGTLLTTVMDVKRSGPDTYLVCDAGVNVLGGMYGLGRLVVPKAQPAGQPGDAERAVLVGPLCTPLDLLSRSARVHRPGIGDLVAIPNVGAYGLTASLVAFLGRPLPVEVVLDGADLVAARRLRLVETAVTPQGGDTCRSPAMTT